jgi:hypothetical protein
MGMETAGKAPESPFEKRFKINQDIMKLKKDLETVRAGSYSGKAELEAGILADIAEKEMALLDLDNTPPQADKNSPLTIPKQVKENPWGTDSMAIHDRGGSETSEIKTIKGDDGIIRRL